MQITPRVFSIYLTRELHTIENFVGNLREHDFINFPSSFTKRMFDKNIYSVPHSSMPPKKLNVHYFMCKI